MEDKIIKKERSPKAKWLTRSGIIAGVLAVIVIALAYLTSIVPNGTYKLSHINANGKDYTVEEFADIGFFTDILELINEDSTIIINDNTANITGLNVDFSCNWGIMHTKGLTEIAIFEKFGAVKFQYSFGRIILRFNIEKLLEIIDYDAPEFIKDLYKSLGDISFYFVR